MSRISHRLFLTLTIAGCLASPLLAGPEPANLDPVKQEIRAYVKSGAYLKAIGEVAAEAEAWLQERAAQTDASEPVGARARLVVVFDLDETLLYNADHMLRQDFGYVREVWQAWVDRAEAPAIESVRRVFGTARRLGMSVVFITGRSERAREATQRNLRAIGCEDYARLLMRPDGWTETSGAYKLAERKKLAAEGFTVVANLGDQASDFQGGASERDFKLPNPFYLSK